MKGYPRWFVPALLSALLLMFATGLLLAPGTLTQHTGIEIPWRLPATARVWLAALHAAGGFALMLLLGALWSVHMRAGWRRRQQRASGLLLGLMMLLLAISAVAIYYLGDEALGSTAALLHLANGIALAAPFGWHWLRGRRTRSQALEGARQPIRRQATRPSAAPPRRRGRASRAQPRP